MSCAVREMRLANRAAFSPVEGTAAMHTWGGGVWGASSNPVTIEKINSPVGSLPGSRASAVSQNRCRYEITAQMLTRCTQMLCGCQH